MSAPNNKQRKSKGGKKPTAPPLPPRPATGRIIQKGRSLRRVIRHQDELYAISHEDKSIQSVVSTIALPSYEEPVRYSSEYTTSKTATAAPWKKFATVSHTSNVDPAGETWPDATTQTAAVFRNELRSLIIYAPAQAAGVYEATWNDALSGAKTNKFVLPLTPSLNIEIPIVPCFFSYLGGNKIHGDVQYCGIDGQNDLNRYVFLAKSTVLAFSAAITALPATTLEFALTKYVNRDLEDLGVVATITNLLPAATYLIPESAYYSISYVLPATTSSITNVQIYYTTVTNSPQMRHLALPHLETNGGSITQMRMSGVSLLYTNTSNALNRGGQCTFRQNVGAEQWTESLLSTSPYGTISEKEDAVSLRADNGMYGFLKPTDTKSFQLFRSFDVINGLICDSYYPLAESDYLVWALSCSDPDGQLGYLTSSYAVEFLTADVWRKTSSPMVSEALFSKALCSIRDMDQFYENPIHIKKIIADIRAFAKKVYGFARDAAPYVKAAAEIVGPLLAAL